MITAADLADLRLVQREFMDKFCTIWPGSSAQNEYGNTVITYTDPETPYDADNRLPCRVEPGVTPENQSMASRLGVNELWTVTLPALTAVTINDRIAIEGFEWSIAVESVSDGGSFETARVCICSKVQ